MRSSIDLQTTASDCKERLVFESINKNANNLQSLLVTMISDQPALPLQFIAMQELPPFAVRNKFYLCPSPSKKRESCCMAIN